MCNDQRLPRVLEYLRERTGRYPDAIGAPGGFNHRGHWKVAIMPTIDRFDPCAHALMTCAKEHDVELHEYRGGTPGCWAYQIVGAHIVEFFPPSEQQSKDGKA